MVPVAMLRYSELPGPGGIQIETGGSKAPPHLGIQLHNVGHLVPAKAHKSGVIAGTVTRHDHVGLVVSCPLHTVWGLSLPPAGVVCGRVTLGPLVVPVEQDGAGHRAKARSSVRGWGDRGGDRGGARSRAEQRPLPPEGVEGARVQQGQQFGLGAGEAEAVA